MKITKKGETKREGNGSEEKTSELGRKIQRGRNTKRRWREFPYQMMERKNEGSEIKGGRGSGGKRRKGDSRSLRKILRR